MKPALAAILVFWDAIVITEHKIRAKYIGQNKLRREMAVTKNRQKCKR